jgi:hypothetical protein
MPAPDYIPRFVDETLDALMRELPAILLTGPRGCGKTTTALRRAASSLRLDRPEQVPSDLFPGWSALEPLLLLVSERLYRPAYGKPAEGRWRTGRRPRLLVAAVDARFARGCPPGNRP